jgi:hypothetical protein
MTIIDHRGFWANGIRQRDCGPIGRRVRPLAEVLEGRLLLATITVNSSGDSDGADGSATLSLRQAIEISNGTLAISSLSVAQASLVSGPLALSNTIDFNIAGTGPFVISPTSALPSITIPVVIDGDSEPGSHPNTNGPGLGKNTVLQIELDGIRAETGASGLDIQNNGSTVEGLAIGGFSDGLSIQGSALVEGNFIGTDSTGANALPNQNGIVLESSYRVTIGGTAAGAGNVISGNTSAGIVLANGLPFLYIPELSSLVCSDDLIEGNFIGTSAAGTQALPNGTGIELKVSDNITIGGTAAGAGNVISGNTSGGIVLSSTAVVEGGGSIDAGYFELSSQNNLVEGNLIGTDPSGTIPLGNGADGIAINGGSNNSIGGTSTGAGNVIAFNGGSGVSVIALYDSSGPNADGPNAINDAISGNSIFGNGGLGIDLGGDGVTPNLPAGSAAGPNRHQPYPVLTSATPMAVGTLISATLDAAPSTSYTVEFFSNPVADPSGFGQGKTDLGSSVVTTDASGHASFSFTSGLDLLGKSISATATDPSGNTSEFARDLTVGYPTTINLVGPGSIATLGVPTTFAAFVGSSVGLIPSGLVDFFQGGVVIGSAPLNPSGIAVFITKSLSPGPQAITAAYVGDPTHAASQSNAVSISVFAPHAFGGPAVTSVEALVPDLVTIDFNRGLMPGTADDPSNYKIVEPGHGSITVESAVYDPKTDSVTLTTLQKLAPGQTYQLTIKGETGNRIVDVFGIPLNGKKGGKPGHDYEGKVVVKKVPVVKVAHPSGPKTKAQAVAHKKGH